MSIDGIRAVDKEPLAAVDYLFGMSVVNGQRVGPRPIGMQAASQQIASNLPLGNVKSYASVAAMNADVTPTAGTLAYAEGKTWRKSAVSGSPGWEVFLDFIPGAQLINAAVTGGTANAVVATSASPVSATAYKQLILVGPFSATNTGAMTIAINGEPPRALVTNTGAVIVAGYIKANMSALVAIDAAGKYRLFSYGDAAAIQAAAEAAAAAAAVAQAAAEAAAAGVTLPSAVANTMLVQPSSPSGYQALTAPAVRRFLGQGKTIEYFDFVPRNLRDDIAAGVDNTTDQASYWQAFRDALQAVATAGGDVHGIIPQCTIRTSVAPNFAIPRIHLETQGVPKIISTSAAPGFLMDATGMGTGWGLFGLRVGRLQAGTTTGLRGIDIRYCHQSEFDQLTGLGAVGYGIYLSYLVSTVLKTPTFSKSPLKGADFLATPTYGIFLTAEDGDPKGTASGWTTLFNPIAEDVPNGMVVDRALGTQLAYGVAERCTNIGLSLTDHSAYSNVWGTDFESNGVWDVYLTGGYSALSNIHSEKKIVILGNAEANVIGGGVYNDIELGPSTKGNKVQNAMYASQPTGNIVDNGVDNVITNCWAFYGKRYYSSWRNTTGLSVASSGGALGAGATASGKFRKRDRGVDFTLKVEIPLKGAATSGYIAVTMPYPCNPDFDYVFTGIEMGHNADILSARLGKSSTILEIRKADGSYPIAADGNVIVISGTFEHG